MEPLVVRNAVIAQKPRWALPIALGAAVAAAGTVASGCVLEDPRTALAGVGLGVAAAIAWGLANGGGRRKRGTVSASDRGLAFDDELVLPRAQIREGFVQPRFEQSPLVCLTDVRGESVSIDVPTTADARALLGALGLDASQQIATFTVHQGFFANPRLQTAFVALAGTGAWAFVRIVPRMTTSWILFAVFALALIVNAYLPTTVKVGADGMYVRSLTRRRFYPFSQIESVEPSEWGVRLLLKNGKTIDFRTRARKDRPTKDYASAALVERIRAGLARIAEGDAERDAATLVARGDRTLDAWIEGLRAIRAGSYRVAALAEERLWKIVHDASASASARAGAAILLREQLDDEGRAKLRIAAEATAQPKLRIVLEKAAEEGVEGELRPELRAALEACTDEEEEEVPESGHRAG